MGSSNSFPMTNIQYKTTSRIQGCHESRFSLGIWCDFRMYYGFSFGPMNSNGLCQIMEMMTLDFRTLH